MPQPPVTPARSPLDLDRVALLSLGAGLILFVLLNGGVRAISIYFAPIGAALGANNQHGYGWFDTVNHDGLLFALPDLLLYGGVIAFMIARLRGIWTHYRGLNLFALFAGSPPAAPRPSAARPREGDEPFIDSATFEPSPAIDAEPFEPTRHMGGSGWAASEEAEAAYRPFSPASGQTPIAPGSATWQARLRKAYAVLTARRPLGGRPAKPAGRAREALRVLLLPPGQEPDSQDTDQAGERGTRR